ncbi:hypothetical protein [Aneurinibacillus terranovensis]|uniref:hypothetical protein n=1 Tax=Aneurinibacillus terranovensis TaxID=278991 RepID=UPI0003F572BB|nr:hypothetical protein [Aneurinibacillus terranovensis]
MELNTSKSFMIHPVSGVIIHPGHVYEPIKEAVVEKKRSASSSSKRAKKTEDVTENNADGTSGNPTEATE